MHHAKTLSGKPFQYIFAATGELIVYPSDRIRQSQNKSALVVTPYVIQFVKNAIEKRLSILMGASRDVPPTNSLGALLRDERQTPQQLSYLIPVLIDQGFCEYEKDGRAFLIKHRPASK